MQQQQNSLRRVRSRQRSDSARITCKYGQHCPDVRVGRCTFGHPPCTGGRNCLFLQRRACSFYHSPSHFVDDENPNQVFNALIAENSAEDEKREEAVARDLRASSQSQSASVTALEREVLACNEIFEHQQSLLGSCLRLFGEAVVNDKQSPLGQLFGFLGLQSGIKTVFEKMRSQHSLQKFEIQNLTRKLHALKTENEKLKGDKDGVLAQMRVAELQNLKECARERLARIDAVIERKHKEAVVCIFCFEQRKDVVFEPCSHFVACALCADKIQNAQCPICLKHITRKIKVFH